MTKTAIFSAIIMPLALAVGTITTFSKPFKEAGEAMVNTQITTYVSAEKINRAKILREFFAKNKSPLIAHVEKFVEVSDKYDLDYRLLPAISCTESSCGKFLIEESHNPFGWGIYGNLVTSFKSFDEAIEKVGAGLSENYLSRGLDTPEKIGPIYTPPSHGHWGYATRFFMNQMDAIASTL